MNDYHVPGVYVEEISSFPPSVAPVETAIPAFIGYTAFRRTKGNPGVDLAVDTPQKIGSLLEFEELFGRGQLPTIDRIIVDEAMQFVRAELRQNFYLYDAVRLFYANGGGDCYIVSIGALFSAGPLAGPDSADYANVFTTLEGWDDPTIVLSPDLMGLTPIFDGAATADDMAKTIDQLDPALIDPVVQPFHTIQQAMLQHCSDMKDRVAVLDIPPYDANGAEFRNHSGINGLSYGAAYTPFLTAALSKRYLAEDINGLAARLTDQNDVTVTLDNLLTEVADPAVKTALINAATTGSDEVKAAGETALRAASPNYRALLSGLNGVALPVPPSGAAAGIYAYVDRTRGVWKAPANVSVSSVKDVVSRFSELELAKLNVDVNAGKSINVIRPFTGKGILVYGARTLLGNDAEYRYVSVRRLMNMLEESIEKACEQFVFEPNNADTWTRVQAMIENFLTLLWRDGALQGAKPEHAFSVAVGLGKTMNATDVIEGRMIVEMAVAPVRPAEFIILRFMQHLPTS